METSTLRWILIIIGLAIIAAVWLFSTMERNRKPKATRRQKEKQRAARGAVERREPTLAGVGGGDQVAAEKPAGQGELEIDERPQPMESKRREPRRAPLGPPPDKIVSLFLLARDGHVITGAELLQATVSTGLKFGDMDIFHRLSEGSEKPVFSMANAAKPGHFERDEWNTFETGGVVLFMTLPGPEQALDAWDAMLAAGRRMADILNADLLDGDRSPFTRQREAQHREEMRDYDRSKAAAD
ncbi:MAG: cell division protein ZipA [Xanthomonadales bacterium]